MRRYQNKSPENAALGDSIRTRLGALLTPPIMCLVLHRCSHFLHVRGFRRAARVFAGANLALFKVNVSASSCIGPGCLIPHPGGVTFHGVAGCGVTLYTQSVCGTREARLSAPVEAGPWLGDRVSIGCGAAVMGAVFVGDDVSVAPVAHLRSDAPSGVIVISPRMRSRARASEARADEA